MKTRPIRMCEMVTQPNQCFLMAKAERPFPWLQLLQVSDLSTSLFRFSPLYRSWAAYLARQRWVLNCHPVAALLRHP